MAGLEQNPYDEVLYPGCPFSQTHPDRLATLARLFGMKPAAVENCRVLELGCGDGGNLIPMAFGLPGSEFVGIDLAARPIRSGQALVEALGLKNITLRPLDIMQISSDFGRFDYIIAHGLYSWVPPAVQDKILAICKANLAPEGVAYVSYNTYPGGHLRNLVREMMLFHVRDLTEPEQRVQQARALIKFLAESQAEPDPYRAFLKKELERITQYREAALYHDDLAEINSPVYFYRFIEQATRHQLQYLAEAHLFEIQMGIFPPHVAEELNQLTDNMVVKEQYLDFLKCRRFRQTLLCHQDIALDRRPKPERIVDFYVASPARPTSAQPDIDSRSVEEFGGPKGSALKTDNPLIKAAMAHLGETWPQSCHFSELLATARSRSGRYSACDDFGFDEDARELGGILLRTHAAGLTELHVHSPQFVLTVSERPVASALARLQIQNGSLVTNLCHASVQVTDKMARCLLQLLDGTRDRTALLTELTAFLESDITKRREEREPVSQVREALSSLAEDLEPNLAKLARLALLVG
jgi:methyltransferase-like protein/2-polyprenyl-3-methyl-5-hydroxy-6-metoxy-1,4-benzoquinol methylase